MGKKVAVLLSGCGNKDGSEVQESVLALYSLDKHGLSYQCYAPDAPQIEVIDYLANAKTSEHRNQMKEAARIARSDIKPVTQLNPADYAAIIIPGGGGANLKNLSNYFYDRDNPRAADEVQKVIRGFHQAGKPIGAICAATVMVAVALKDIAKDNIIVATGTSYLDKFTDKIDRKTILSSEIVIDNKNKIVSTPAYINDASISEVGEGIDKLVGQIAQWV
jgi:enhancing lycopene biosynthesis protein 2